MLPSPSASASPPTTESNDNGSDELSSVTSSSPERSNSIDFDRIEENDKDDTVPSQPNGSIATGRSSGPSLSSRQSSQPQPSLINDSAEPEPINVLKARKNKKNARSEVWKYFEVFKDPAYKSWTYCSLCKSEVYYTDTMSTGMLTRHLRQYHKVEYNNVLASEVSKKARTEAGKEEQPKISTFVTYTPSYEKCFLDFVVETYQPISICEHRTYRALCQSLNIKAPIYGREKAYRLISKEVIDIREGITAALKGMYFAATTDAWTANNNVNYTTCTVHFIDKKTWILHHFALGIFKKTGTSKAEDVVAYCHNIWQSVDLQYKFCSAIVTDTEATMCKAGRLFTRASSLEGGSTHWHGCVDHILELITKIAMKDYEGSEGTMAAARALVGHFSSSSQAEQRLLNLQPAGTRAVKCIQDVATRWWSTFSMCERLLRLKPYFALMEAEGNLDCNLTDSQWLIVEDTCTVLQPFMFAQRTLEGECYVTNSMVPYILYKIRASIQQARDSPTISVQAANLLRKMANAFEVHWGSGEPGTVATEHLTEGPNRRPRGLPIRTLLASLLDPRFKCGVGLAIQDKEYLWNYLLQQMIVVEREVRASRAAALQQNENNINGNNNDALQQQPQQQRWERGAFHNMFQDLNEYREAMEVRRHAVNRNNNNNEPDEHEKAQAELTMYKAEPILALTNDDEAYNNPLEWWKYNAKRFPLLSELASRYLCIPATSAPSERVFSSAGLTIAKDRSRLDPELANELVFLHESGPALQRFRASQTMF